jgi:uncharacterized protein involved in exopolysaccharide biosynthesis
MNEKTQTSDDFNSLNVLYVMYKWRKPLIIIGIATVIISSIMALSIQDKYKSTVILFPSTTNSISKALLTEENQYIDVLAFGKEEEAEQMLQILNSDEIRDRICEKYNLMAHYKIDPNSEYKHTHLNDEFQSNVTFKRTEYMSVKIEVMDIDPKIAAAIGNDIAALYDSTKINIQRQRAIQAFEIVEKEYLAKEKEVTLLSDSLTKINKLGISDIQAQVERTSEQYAIAVRMGDQRATKALEEKLKIFSDYGTSFVKFRDNVYAERNQLNSLKTKYERAKVDAEAVLPQKFVVSRAFPAEKKSYPIRWIIIVVLTLTTLLISILAVLLLENLPKYRVK